MELRLKGNVSEKIFDPTISIPTLKSARYNLAGCQDTLRRIHKKYWVACDCSDGQSPIMTVRKNGNLYTLVNLTGYGTHVKGCPFHYIPIKTNVSAKGSIGNEFVLNVTNNSNASESDISTNMNTLRRLMLYLVDKSNVSTTNSERSFSSNIRDILDTGVNDVYVNGTEIKRRTYFGLDKFLKIKETLQNDIETKGHVEPCFLVDVVDSVETFETHLLVKKRSKGKEISSFKFYNELSKTSGLSIEKGPFLVLSSISYVQTKSRKIVAPTLAYFQPIANKVSWLPVNNVLERVVIEKVTSSLKWYKKHLGLEFTCSRLLKPIHNDLGRSHPLLKFELGAHFAYLDIQLNKDTSKNIQRTLDYIVLSKSAGGVYCIFDEDQTDDEIQSVLFNAINELLKAIKNASHDKPPFNKQMKCVS